MCRSSPPPPTNPLVTSAANQAGNVNTAVANSWLGNADQFGPNGSTVFNQIGQEQVKDALGNVINVPRFSQTTTLSPEQQKIYDAQTKASQGMLGLANSQIDRLGGVLGAPLDFSHLPKGGTLPTTGPEFTGLQSGPEFARLTGGGLPIQMGVNLAQTPGKFAASGPIQRAVNPRLADVTTGPQDWSEDRLRVEKAIRDRANPQLEQRGRALDASLEAQGFRRGTAAFDAAKDEHNRSLNDFELATIGAGGAEQSRLARDAFTQFGLENQAVGQNNAAQLAAGDYFNRAQAQKFAEDQARGVFGQGATAQNNAARLAAAQYGLGAQGQAFGQRGQMVGQNNAVAQQEAQNEWNRIMYGNDTDQRRFSNATNLAQLQDTQRERAIQEYLLPRQTAINEIGAIRSGSQVQNPQFTPYQAGRVADTSVGANILAADAMRNQQWQQEQQSQNAMLGGLFGLAGTGVMGGMRYGFNPSQWGMNPYQPQGPGY